MIYITCAEPGEMATWGSRRVARFFSAFSQRVLFIKLEIDVRLLACIE